MKPHVYRIASLVVLIAMILIIPLASACSHSGNEPPKITGIKADSMYLYPKGSAELECLALDPEGDTMTFTWSCADGTFVGSGPIVTWQAPNAYGDFHIMVIVEDGNGHSAQRTITVGVIVNENDQGCSTCPTRR